MIIECMMAWCMTVPTPSMTAPDPELDVDVQRVSAPAAPSVWDRLAECESHGEWDYGPHSRWGSQLYHGGLQFDPDTWSEFRPEGFPEVAYEASREQQIAVAERVLEVQGWKAWPACSRKLGLR